MQLKEVAQNNEQAKGVSSEVYVEKLTWQYFG